MVIHIIFLVLSRCCTAGTAGDGGGDDGGGAAAPAVVVVVVVGDGMVAVTIVITSVHERASVVRA